MLAMCVVPMTKFLPRMLRSRTTVRIMEQIMSGDNYQWIFSRQKEAIVI